MLSPWLYKWDPLCLALTYSSLWLKRIWGLAVSQWETPIHTAGLRVVARARRGLSVKVSFLGSWGGGLPFQMFGTFLRWWKRDKNGLNDTWNLSQWELVHFWQGIYLKYFQGFKSSKCWVATSNGSEKN